MSHVSGINQLGVLPPSANQHDKLRRAADELEGIFLNQLFQAMRKTVPDGLMASSSGEDMFRAMLDEQLAKEAAVKWKGGIGEALYQQLSRRLAEGPSVGSEQRTPSPAPGISSNGLTD